MIGAAAFAGSVPRVYQYTATLNTAVAKNAAKVTWKDDDGHKQTVLDVCYRVKGKVTFKGAVVLGCNCVPDADIDGTGYPLVLLTSSEDKYKTLYVYENGVEADILDFVAVPLGFDQDWVWAYNRIGNPLSSKATVAEMGFDTLFVTGLDDDCVRLWDLWHAGFGKSAIIDRGDGTMDLSSLSGNVVGWVNAPFCSAVDNSCPRCLEDGECEAAIAFEPCDFADPFDFDQQINDGVAYGTFSLKFNKTYSTAIKPVVVLDNPNHLMQTVNALAAKAFKQIKTADQVKAFLVPVEPAEGEGEGEGEGD